MSSKRKALLCCLVNAAGTCRRCREKKCDTHSFKCVECRRVCTDCCKKYECKECEEIVCGKCSMDSSRTILCRGCYNLLMSDDGDGLNTEDFHIYRDYE